MKKYNFLLMVFLGLAIYIFSPLNFASAVAPLTCGGDKTEDDCLAVGGAVVEAGNCTVCKIQYPYKGVGNVNVADGDGRFGYCPAGMKQYSQWANYKTNICGSYTTDSGWMNSATPSIVYPSVGYKMSWPYGNCTDLNFKCPEGYTQIGSCQPGCNPGAGNDTIVCKSNNEYTTNYHQCYSEQTHTACIGSGTTPAIANSCQGAVSPNALAWDTEESSSLVNSTTKWTCSASDTNAKCQYKCNPNFTCFSDNLRSGCVPPAPEKPTVTCDSNGIITVNGPTVAGEGIWYAVRIDDVSDGWDPNNLSPKDHIFDELETYNKTYQGEIGETYRVWGNAVVENGDHDLWAIDDQTINSIITVTCDETDNDDTTINFSCTNIPENSRICSGSNAGLTANTPATLVSNCEDPSNHKCQYFCKDKYMKNENTCVLISSTVPNLCGPAGSRDRSSSEAWYDIYASGFRGKFCVNAEPATLPSFPPTGGHVEWICYDTTGANPQKCYARRNSNGSRPIDTDIDEGETDVACQNFPPPSFCPSGTEDIIATGTDSNGCSIYGCKSSSNTIQTPVVSATCDSKGKINISWLSVVGADRYALRIDANKTPPILPPHLLEANDISKSETSYTWPKGKIGTTYTYWLHAVKENGENDVWSTTQAPVPTVTCAVSDGEAESGDGAECGTANGKIYGADEKDFGNDTFCAQGVEGFANLQFPDQGKIVNWKCRTRGNQIINSLLFKKTVTCYAGRKSKEDVILGCGDAAGMYLGTDTAFRSNNFCGDKYSPSPTTTPTFPATTGGSSYWICEQNLLDRIITVFRKSKAVVCTATKG
ncbi:MAG: hypothetical protein WC678_03445 [Parcubacteria group bacterium]|jgi:hypothetical protein